jgi:hypothetical protein
MLLGSSASEEMIEIAKIAVRNRVLTCFFGVCNFFISPKLGVFILKQALIRLTHVWYERFKLAIVWNTKKTRAKRLFTQRLCLTNTTKDRMTN